MKALNYNGSSSKSDKDSESVFFTRYDGVITKNHSDSKTQQQNVCLTIIFDF